MNADVSSCASAGPMVTASWDPVSESGRGRVAVPDVGAEGTDGAQVVTGERCLFFPFFSPSLSLLLDQMQCTTPGGDNMLSIAHL